MTATAEPLTHRLSASARPLLVSADAGVIDAVQAVAAQAGVDVLAFPDAEAASSAWAAAPLVLIDAHEALQLQHLPSRRGVVVVSRTISDADTWRALLATGPEHIVELPLGAPWLFERMGRSLEVGPAVRTGVIAVTGAVGGVGASSLAAALAAHQSTGDRPAVLVDLDSAGGGIDLMLGAEDVPGARWNELSGISGPVDESVLLGALPARDGLVLLSWPAIGEIEPDATTIGHVLDALVRVPNPVVIDLGRGGEPRSQSALARADACVIVVPLRVRAVTAAQRLLHQLSPHVEPLVVVRGPAPGGITADDVAAALAVDVVATLGDDRRRATDEEVGGPAPGSSQWRRACVALLDRRP